MEAPALDNKTEIVANVALLNQRPEIENKVEYYKSILRANDSLVKAIEKKIEYGFEDYSGSFLGIPLSFRRKLSDYDRAKLLQEKIELENQMYYQRSYFESWLQRRNEYEVYFDALSAEVNERFDSVYAQAEELAKINPKLAERMRAYKNEKDEQWMKNDFYLYLRQEIRSKK